MALTRQEEGIVLISGWMLLGLKQGVKVPEGALYEVVGWHLCEATQKLGVHFVIVWVCVQKCFLYCHNQNYSPHLQEDLPKLCSHLQQRVQVATVRRHAQGLKVVWFKLLLFPAATETQHKPSCQKKKKTGRRKRKAFSFAVSTNTTIGHNFTVPPCL